MRAMKPLTEKTASGAWIFVEEFSARQGYPPTVREVAAHFAIQPRAAADHLEALNRKGISTGAGPVPGAGPALRGRARWWRCRCSAASPRASPCWPRSR